MRTKAEQAQIKKKQGKNKDKRKTNDVENNCKSTKYEIYSENAKKSSGDKRTIKQKQRTKSEANVPEEEVNVRQSKDKNINISHTVQDKLQRNSDENMEEDEEISVSISKNQLLSVGKCLY